MAQVWDQKLGKYVNDNVTTVEPRTESQEVRFKLIVPRDVMDKISWWMHKTDKEVSGFGSLDFDPKTSTFTVRDAILLKQEVGPASAEIDPHAMAKAMYRMRSEKNGLKWHWHSHVNMGVFWSADDMEIIRSLGQRGWILATVFNYAEEHKTAYFTQTSVPNPEGGDPITHDVFMNDLPTTVTNFIPARLYEAWDKEYAENVTEEKYLSHEWGWMGEGNVLDVTKGLEDKELKEMRYSEESTDKNADYDEFGYAVVDNFPRGIIYNPCFDKNLKSKTEKYEMISEMSPDELDFLETHSTKFQNLMKDYMVREANVADLQSQLPFGKDTLC